MNANTDRDTSVRFALTELKGLEEDRVRKEKARIKTEREHAYKKADEQKKKEEAQRANVLELENLLRQEITERKTRDTAFTLLSEKFKTVTFELNDLHSKLGNSLHRNVKTKRSRTWPLLVIAGTIVCFVGIFSLHQANDRNTNPQRQYIACHEPKTAPTPHPVKTDIEDAWTTTAQATAPPTSRSNKEKRRPQENRRPQKNRRSKTPKDSRNSSNSKPQKKIRVTIDCLQDPLCGI